MSNQATPKDRREAAAYKAKVIRDALALQAACDAETKEEQDKLHRMLDEIIKLDVSLNGSTDLNLDVFQRVQAMRDQRKRLIDKFDANRRDRRDRVERAMIEALSYDGLQELFDAERGSLLDVMASKMAPFEPDANKTRWMVQDTHANHEITRWCRLIQSGQAIDAVEMANCLEAIANKTPPWLQPAQ